MLASAVAWSRLNDSAHSLSQVCFGAGLGIASGLATLNSFEELTGWQQRVANLFVGEKNFGQQTIGYQWLPQADDDGYSVWLNLRFGPRHKFRP